MGIDLKSLCYDIRYASRLLNIRIVTFDMVIRRSLFYRSHEVGFRA